MTNYENGARMERRLVEEARQRGGAGIRSAGSRGFADALILTAEGQIHAIQCKKEKLSPKDRRDAIDRFKEYKIALHTNHVRCLLIERYERKDHISDITKEIY